MTRLLGKRRRTRQTEGQFRVLSPWLMVSEFCLQDLQSQACAWGWALPDTVNPPRAQQRASRALHGPRPATQLGGGKISVVHEQKHRAHKLGGPFGAWAFLKLAGRCQIVFVYCLLLVDQILQTGLDWFLLVAALRTDRARNLLSFHWQFGTCWINLMLKVGLAHAAASCCTAAGEAFHSRWLKERVMKACDSSRSLQMVMQDMTVVDLGLSHQVWVILAMLCSTLGLLCLVHVRLPLPAYGFCLALPAYGVACWCLFKSFHCRVNLHRNLRDSQNTVYRSLSDTFAAGATGKLLAKDLSTERVTEAGLMSSLSLQPQEQHVMELEDGGKNVE